MKKRVSLLLGAACSAILFSNAASAQSAYSAQQLSGGFYWTMNNIGQLAGTDTTQTSYIYTDANGLGLHTLDTPSGFAVSDLLAINNLGQVAGVYGAPDQTALQGFYTTTSGAVVSTSANGQPLPGITSINDQGQMVGFNLNVGAPLTSQGGAVWQPISALDNGVDATTSLPSRWVLTINNQGQMSGISLANFNNFLASADGSTVTEPVNSLNGLADTHQEQGKFLNDKGQLVGNYWDTNSNFGVYLTGPNGTGATTLNGISVANYLNNTGQIAGYRLDGTPIAVITGNNGQNAVDLDTLYSLTGDSFNNALAINDVGQVLATTVNGREYLLTPVPEASTGMLMLLGLCGLGLARRRQHSTGKH